MSPNSFLLVTTSIATIISFFLVIFTQSSANASNIQDWKLQHCNYDNNQDRVSFQIHLPLRNTHLLGNSSSYEISSLQQQKNKEEQKIQLRLAKARSIFLPSEEDFVASENFLFNVKNIPKNLCKRKNKDSIRCSNIPPKTVETIFQNKIHLCYYTHEKSSSHSKKHLMSEIKPVFTAGGHFSSSSTKTNKAFVSGLSLHGFPTRFGQQKKEKQQQQNNINLYSSGGDINDFPIANGSTSSPVIIRIQEIEYLNPDNTVNSLGLQSVTLVLNCLDGTSAAYTGNSAAPVSCPSSQQGAASMMTPNQIAIRIHDEQGGNLQQPSYNINNNAAKISCAPTGTNFGQHVSTQVQNTVACTVHTQSDITGLVPYQRYSISAIVYFGSDNIGQSGVTPMRNYYAGSFGPYPSSTPPPGDSNSIVSPIFSLTAYPSDIKKKYGIDADEQISLMKSATVSQGVFEFGQIGEGGNGGGYVASDVVEYMKKIGNANYDDLPIHYIGAETFEYLDSGEAALDIELIMAMGLNAPTVFWSVSLQQGNPNADFGSFLEACTNLFSALANNETSDDFPSDIPYPTSWSISFGLSEFDAMQESEDMLTKSDQYLQMLSAVGIHVYVSSGDSGATDGDGQVSMAHYPAVLPHAVAVGATALLRKPGNPDLGEVVCSALDQNIITSGGAVSQFFDIPSYQQPFLTTSHRGVPDVAALGANIFAVVNGNTAEMYGTSASAPIFAGIMSLISNRLVLAGKSPLENAHSFFYSQQSAMSTKNADGFFDITSGNNCGTRANNNLVPINFPTLTVGECYFASGGYDFVTGVGSPKFDKLVFNLTGQTVAPNTFAPGGGGGGSGSSSGNNNDNGNNAANDAIDYVEDHWKYFAIGGGALVLILLICCAVLKKRSMDAEKREELLYGSSSNSPRSGRRSARGGYGTTNAINNNNDDMTNNGSLSSRNGVTGARYHQV